MREPDATHDGRLAFANFALDTRTGELRRDGALVPLRQQALAALLLLASHPGELVTRDDLRRAVWPAGGDDVDVELGLNGCIKELRAALGDDARAPRLIETLPKRGYRFIADMTRARDRAPDARGARTAAVAPRWASDSNVRRSRLRLTALAALLAAAAVAGGPRQPTDPLARTLIALLPLRQTELTPEATYLADGLTEELGAQLRRLAPTRLGVIAHGSAARFRSEPRDLNAIGRELGARFVAEGSLESDGRRVLIALNVVDTRQAGRGFALTHDANLRDVQALPRRVARELAAGIGVVIARAERPAEASPVDPQAYDLYLRALQAHNRRNPAGLELAGDHLRRALERQPDFARAHALLAQVVFLNLDVGLVPRARAIDVVRHEALEALRLDPTLAQAHIALAVHRLLEAWDWKGAELRHRQALGLDPNYATAHHWYANLLVNQRRTGEALAEIRRALELDPLSLIINQAAASILLIAGRDAESAAQVERLLRLDPNWSGSHFARARLLLKTGRAAEALAAFERANAGSQGATPLAWLVYANARAGRRDVAAHLRREIASLATPPRSVAYELAIADAALGNADAAFAALDQALADRHPALRYLGADERLESLHADARFAGVAQRLGLRLQGGLLLPAGD